MNHNDIIHSHIAVSPTPPIAEKNKIHPAFSAIIMKLISKIPEDRYQSVGGLLLDIESVKNTSIEKNKNNLYKLGLHDITKFFQIPEKIYGFDEILNNIKKFVIDSGEVKGRLLILTGTSGSGKTTLLEETDQLFRKNNIPVLASDFSQERKHIPYSAFNDILNSLVKLVLFRKEKDIQRIRKTIETEIIKPVVVLKDTIPSLDILIPSLKNESSNFSETEYRYIPAYSSLLEILLRESNRLVVAFDNLDCIDNFSLELMEHLITNKTGEKITFIATADNEFHPDNLDPASYFTEKNIKYQQEAIPSLQPEDINCLLQDTIQLPEKELRDITKIVFSKSEGIPRHLIELLVQFHEKKVIFFDGIWNYDASLAEKEISINSKGTVNLDNIKTISDRELKILKFCAISKQPITDQLLTNLMALPRTKYIEYISNLINNGFLASRKNRYSLRHKSLKKSILNRMSAEEIQLFNYNTALALLSNNLTSETNENLYVITSHLNEADNLCQLHHKTGILFSMNYKAGLQAKKARAFTTAHQFLSKAVKLFPRKEIEKRSFEAIELFSAFCEVLFREGRINETEEYLELLYLASGNNINNQVRIEEIKITGYTLNYRYDRAIEASRKALSLLRYNIPKKNFKLHTMREIAFFKRICLRIY